MACASNNSSIIMILNWNNLSLFTIFTNTEGDPYSLKNILTIEYVPVNKLLIYSAVDGYIHRFNLVTK